MNDSSEKKNTLGKRKKLLFFGGPAFQIPIIKKAKEMGCFVGVIDMNPHALAIEFADEYIQGDLRNNNELLQLARKFKPDGIMIGACDTSVVSASYVANMLNLPGHSIPTALRATNKLEMLKAFEENGVAHPKYQLIKKDSIDDAEILIPLPVISKPVDGSGSRGLSIIITEKTATAAIKYSSENSICGDVLVEEYMNGPEVSVEMLIIDGIPYVLQITDKITSGAPYFFETGHSQPSALPDDVKTEISELAKAAAKALGIWNSPAHAEIKVTEDGPKMVEIGARMGGGCISTYLIDNTVSGINMSEAAIKMALGEYIENISFQNSGKSAAVKFLLAEKGVIKSISGIEEAKRIKGVIKVGMFGKIGDSFETTSDNASRLGFVIASADNTGNALAVCDQAINKINVFYE